MHAHTYIPACKHVYIYTGMKTLSVKNKTWVEGLALWCVCVCQVTGSVQHVLPQQLTTDKQFTIVLYPILFYSPLLLFGPCITISTYDSQYT